MHSVTPRHTRQRGGYRCAHASHMCRQGSMEFCLGWPCRPGRTTPPPSVGEARRPAELAPAATSVSVQPSPHPCTREDVGVSRKHRHAPPKLDAPSGEHSGQRAHKRPAGSGRAPPGPPPSAALRQPQLLLLGSEQYEYTAATFRVRFSSREFNESQRASLFKSMQRLRSRLLIPDRTLDRKRVDV